MMTQKTLAIVGVLVVSMVVFALAADKAGTPNSVPSDVQAGRFQLIRTMDGNDYKGIFDTATGRLWINVGPSEFESVPAFIPVRRIDDIEEGLKLLKKAAEAAEKKPLPRLG